MKRRAFLGALAALATKPAITATYPQIAAVPIPLLTGELGQIYGFTFVSDRLVPSYQQLPKDKPSQYGWKFIGSDLSRDLRRSRW